VLQNLAQQVFAHETPVYGGVSDPFMTADMAHDALANAIGALDDRVEQAERRRRPDQRRASSAEGPTPADALGACASRPDVGGVRGAT
jgi:hypothetical protein